MPTTVATGMREPRMQGTPPIWSGFTVTRENLIFDLNDNQSNSIQKRFRKPLMTLPAASPRLRSVGLSGRFGSSQELRHDISMDVGQAEESSLVLVGQPGVVQAHE